MFKSKHISVFIDRPADEVYAFASDPKNLPTWAAGIGNAVKVKFVEKNELGVIDHDVTLPSGEVIHVPFRVLKNDRGSEVILTLFQGPGMSDEQFAQDEKMVRDDLEKLKALLER